MTEPDALERVKSKLSLWPNKPGGTASVLSVDDLRALVREVEAARRWRDAEVVCTEADDSDPGFSMGDAVYELYKAREAYDAVRKGIT